MIESESCNEQGGKQQTAYKNYNVAQRSHHAENLQQRVLHNKVTLEKSFFESEQKFAAHYLALKSIKTPAN